MPANTRFTQNYNYRETVDVSLGYGMKQLAILSPEASCERVPQSVLSTVYKLGTLLPLGEGVMESNGWPLDPASATALVMRVIDDIDGSDDEQRDSLLTELLCAAWGRTWAQNQ